MLAWLLEEFADLSKYPPGYFEESRTSSIIAGNVVCQTVGTLFVLARVYSRLCIIGAWKAEDWTLVVAWVHAVRNLSTTC